jgi:hypothetical protein
VSIYITLSSFIILHYLFSTNNLSYLWLVYVSFATIFQVEFHNLVEQFCKGGPTFCIMKNIVGNNKGDMRLLTIASVIITWVFHSIQ